MLQSRKLLIWALVAQLALLAGLGLVASARAQDEGGVSPGEVTPDDGDNNPCTGPGSEDLLCPDLKMSTPFGLYVQRTEKRVRLRAGNSINSRGDGPLEVRGTRVNSTSMTVKQAIYRRGRSTPLLVKSKGRLDFKDARPHGLFWKFRDPARFELWSVDSRGKRSKLVRSGPKIHYCLRDLTHTAGKIERSPDSRVYPACNQNRSIRRVTLGTSTGWSDVYPPTYPEQYIDVTGLRGTYIYRHVADPTNVLHESHEDNNDAQVTVRLPFGRSSPSAKYTNPDADKGAGDDGY